VVAGPFLPRAVPSGTQAIAASPTLRLREMSRLLRLLSVAGRARSRGLACRPRGTFGVVMARPYFSTWQRDRTRGALQEVPQPLPANARPDRLMSVRLFSAPQALKRAVQQLPHSIPSRYPRRAPFVDGCTRSSIGGARYPWGDYTVRIRLLFPVQRGTLLLQAIA
jgi:hypothetical protein